MREALRGAERSLKQRGYTFNTVDVTTVDSDLVLSCHMHREEKK